MTSRRAALADFLPALLLDGGFYLAFFALSHLLADAGAGSLAVGGVYGGYTLTYAVLAPLLGRASDRIGRRGGLLLGALGFAAVALGLGLVLGAEPRPGLPHRVSDRSGLGVTVVVVGGAGLLGLANALLWPALQVRLAERHAGVALTRALRRFNLGWTVGKALGFVLGGAWYARSPATCLPGAAAVGVLVLLSLLIEPAATPAAEPASAAEPGWERPERDVRRGFLLAALVSNFTVWGALSTLVGLAPKLLGQGLGLGATAEGLVLGLALLAQGAGFLALGERRRWVYRRGVLLAAVPLAGLGLLVLGLAPGAGGAALAAVLVGLAQAVTYAASMFYSLDYEASGRGLRTGIHEANLALGGALPLLGGWLADWSGVLAAPLWLVLGCAALTGPAALAALRSGRAAGAPPAAPSGG